MQRDLDAKLGNLLRERELESMAHSGGGDGGIKEDLHFAEQDVIRATRKLHEQEVACEKAIKAADDSKTRLDELRQRIASLSPSLPDPFRAQTASGRLILAHKDVRVKV